VVQQQRFISLKAQVDETMMRFDQFSPLLRRYLTHQQEGGSSISQQLDRILTHRIFGPIIFFLIMLLIFQSIYAWATYPMDAIDWIFAALGSGIQSTLGDGWLSSLLIDGLLAGLGGIVVFVPQIAILFFLISILEEVGYMARAAFMFDRLMQAFGLNGRSIVALISGGACAIPAVMSTRTISNWKERLITILVTPFISCSARIPVYTVLIGFAVPAVTVAGIFNLRGLAFMGLYLLGIIAALLAAFVFKLILKTREHSFLMLEMPEYRMPVMRNVWINVWEKVKTFVLEAGKVILAISVVLWLLASFAPPGEMEQAEAEARTEATEQSLDETATEDLIAAKQIETSYAGRLGKIIEPAIRPLGFDWKIGIALITSFAAREVFVGTMATIYSIGSESDEVSVRDRMATEVDPATGKPVYNRATSWSLLLFYVFAMMCMSTLAVVKRETKSWKWPVIQFVFMTALAYFSSLAAYQWLS
jgi:ferrous iron transport protein B